MPNVLDGCAEEGPLLTPALLKPKTITKAQIQRCISKLSPRLDDAQREAVVSMFKARLALSGMIAGLPYDTILTESDVLIGV